MERWKPVVGWEGVYEVSDLGRVKRLVPGRQTYAGRIFEPAGHPRGYVFITLCHEGRKVSRPAHLLVLEAFVGPKPSPTHQGNHKDGVRTNNTVDNLEWVTVSENRLHAYRVLGNKPPSQFWAVSPNAKLSAGQVSDIRRIRAETKASYKDLAEQFGVHLTTIGRIVKGKAWA